MTIDVIDLRDFYSQRLGIVARQLINRGIRERWPNAEGQRVLGLGYPTPYLGLFREDSERCIAFMPAAQGVLKWPTARPALATLIDEFSMPLPDAAVDQPPRHDAEAARIEIAEVDDVDGHGFNLTQRCSPGVAEICIAA